MPLVLVIVGRVNEYVIQVHKYEAVEQVSQRRIHKSLERTRSICKSKWHYYPFEQPKPTYERTLMAIVRVYFHLVIALREVYLTKHSHLGQAV